MIKDSRNKEKAKGKPDFLLHLEGNQQQCELKLRSEGPILACIRLFFPGRSLLMYLET